MGRLPRSRHSERQCNFWNPELERLWKDTKRLRLACGRDIGNRENYNLVRAIYRQPICQRHHEQLRDTLQNAGDPAIFEIIGRAETHKTLPPMKRADDSLATTHSQISDLIADQLDSGEPSVWPPEMIDIEPVDCLSTILREGPQSTTPGICDIRYPMLKRGYKRFAGVVLPLINYGLRHDIENWPTGEVILIPKANNPDYAVVKAWRMIHLLPILAKTAERIVLGRVSDDVELDTTMFGSQRRKGVHDCIALAYEVFDANKSLSRAIMSVNVEGGFDNVDITLLGDIMMARECKGVLVEWVQRWARRRKLYFRFNGGTSKSYNVAHGIRQGSPLSPYLFGIYVADIFRCRLKYTPTVRRAVLSYVDDGLVVVAGSSREVCAMMLSETFDDIDRVARGWGMSFSAIKTDWLGFGGGWDGIDIGGVRKEPVELLRCLVFFFNVAGDLSSHVEYWTRRALDVRRRIAAIGRRFGSIGGIGAWELWRLISTIFVPTIGYCVEWIGDNKKAVDTLQVHTNDCIRSCFRIPPRTANNILLGETGIPPWHVRLRYFRRKCYLQMLSYRYGGDLPWFGCVRQSWGEEDVVVTN